MSSNELRAKRSLRWGKASVEKTQMFLQLFAHALPKYDRKKNEPRARLAHTGKKAIPP